MRTKIGVAVSYYTEGTVKCRRFTNYNDGNTKYAIGVENKMKSLELFYLYWCLVLVLNVPQSVLIFLGYA